MKIVRRTIAPLASGIVRVVQPRAAKPFHVTGRFDPKTKDWVADLFLMADDDAMDAPGVTQEYLLCDNENAPEGLGIKSFAHVGSFVVWEGNAVMHLFRNVSSLKVKGKDPVVLHA